MNKAFMEDYYETYNSEDPEALSEFYHPKVELVSSQGTQKGIDALLATYSYLISTFHDQMTPEQISVDGDTVSVTLVDEFTAKVAVDDFMGMRLAKGDSFELRLHAQYTFEDDLMKHIVITQLDDNE